MPKQALQGKRGTVFYVEPSLPVIIGLDTEHKKGEHPLWDKRIKLPVDRKLVNNIKVYGVIDPVKCRKEGDDAIVADGRQRLRAARVACEELVAEGKEPLLVPVIIKRGSDAMMFGVMVSANEQRQDDGVLVKADKAATMLGMGKDEAEIAIAFGVTEQAVRSWLALLDLHGDVRKEVEKGNISASAAAKLAPLNRDDQVTEMKAMIEEGNATTAQASARARVRKSGGTSEDVTVAPGKRSIRKLLDYLNAQEEELFSEEFILGVRWAIGDYPTKSIGGLSKAIREATAKPKKKKAPLRKGKK